MSASGGDYSRFYMYDGWVRYHLTHFKVNKNGRLNKQSNFYRTTELLMGRDEIQTQVYLISKSTLFLLLYTVLHTIPYKKMTFWSLHLLFHKFDFSSKCCSWRIPGLCSLTLREGTYWVALHGTLGQCFSGRATGKWIEKRDKGSDYFQGVLRLSMWGLESS